MDMPMLFRCAPTHIVYVRGTNFPPKSNSCVVSLRTITGPLSSPKKPAATRLHPTRILESWREVMSPDARRKESCHLYIEPWWATGGQQAGTTGFPVGVGPMTDRCDEGSNKSGPPSAGCYLAGRKPPVQFVKIQEINEN
uniref:Uncharacterized protein n=1 Tax=Branchiostoma floridae TaxID=7739 RepID=C3XQD7_BRAFL|eukprot:XP_002613741.1 hypothetical protein BRAFLDRAFT_84489 [Branchiostoma floridae]